MQKRIFYITPGLNVGGAEKFLLLLSEVLSREGNIQSIISLTATNKLEEEVNKNVRFRSLLRKHKFDIIPLFKLRKLIKSERPDVIFCINFFSYFFVRCSCLFLKNNAKRIISYHSTIHLTKKEYYLHRFYKFLLTKKDRIVTVSLNQAEYTSRELNIPLNKFKTIHNGIDTGTWKPLFHPAAIDPVRKKYNIPESAKLIIKAAAFRKEKNHLGAVRALHLLHTRHNLKAYLLFLGEGSMSDQVKKLVAELKMDSYVIFAGLQKDVRPFYWSGNLFTLCSTNVETFSIAALESMACGLPCVLTDIGGAREMIVEGVTGYLSKTDDSSIAETWFKALKTDFHKEKIFAFIQNHFDSSKMVEEYRKIL